MTVFIGSPNYTKGRNGNQVTGIVCHWMDGNLASADGVFQDTSRNTSAHYGIEDNTVHQYVSEADTAYQAGDWATNLRTIGIEHSAQPGRDASEATYQTSAALIADIGRRYGFPINTTTVVPHGSIIATQCPGTVDVNKLINLANNQGDEMIPDANHLNALFRAFRGREANPDEIAQYVGKVGYSVLVESLDAGPEREATATALADGKVAIRDNWPQQIFDLQAQVKAIQSKLDGLTAQNQGQQATIDKLNQDNQALTDRANAAETRAAALEQEVTALQASQTSPDAPQPVPAPETPVSSPDEPGGFIAALKRLKDWIVSQWNKTN